MNTIVERKLPNGFSARLTENDELGTRSVAMNRNKAASMSFFGIFTKAGRVAALGLLLQASVTGMATASDGQIRFQGQIVNVGCEMQISTGGLSETVDRRLAISPTANLDLHARDRACSAKATPYSARYEQMPVRFQQTNTSAQPSTQSVVGTVILTYQ